ncbi:prohibitin family protein [candidate division WOR-3 bacterium]|nr:prohibitin family protein [candidate division WOR-3 bacterium]
MRGIFIFLFVVGTIVFLFLGFRLQRFFQRRRAGTEVPKEQRKKTSKPLVILAGVSFLALLFTSFIHVVPPGRALVVFWIVTRTYSVAGEGVNFIPPLMSQISPYDLRRVDYTMSSMLEEGQRKDSDDALWAPTSEGLQVGIDLTCWYRLDPAKVAELHRKIGPAFEEKVVRPAIRSTVRLTLSGYTIMDIYSNQRETIQNEIFDKLSKQLGPDGIIVDGVAIRNVQFTTEYSRSIEEKQIAQQRAQKMEYVLLEEQKEAERKIIEAEGKAKAIEIVSQKLRANPNYIKYLYVDKLSDDVKVIVSDQSTIMDLKGLIP